jgi:hypothetical protein
MSALEARDRAFWVGSQGTDSETNRSDRCSGPGRSYGTQNQSEEERVHGKLEKRVRDEPYDAVDLAGMQIGTTRGAASPKRGRGVGRLIG